MNTSDLGKKQTTAGKKLQKGSHGQNTESRAGTSKGKLTNTKLLAPSLTQASIQKQKLLEDKVCKYHHGLSIGLLVTVKTVLFCDEGLYFNLYIARLRKTK